MYFFKLPYILFRNYSDFGYLTDNRNFGYDTASKSCIKVGDRILSKEGSIFYSILSESPQPVEKIAQELLSLFVGVTFQEIVADAIEFYQELAQDGFIGYGEDTTNYYFSYSNWNTNELPKGDEQNAVAATFYSKWSSQYHLSRVHFEVSGPCNERCVHCYFPEPYRKNTMSRDLFLLALEQCKECNVLSITISGGEPMLNPELLYFLRKCRENNFSVNLLSNLTLLSENMLEEFVSTPLLSIQTTLYSMNAEIHDSITSVKGSYEKTKRAIELLHQYNVPMQINCPIMKQNKDTYRDVLLWAKSLNIEADSDYTLFGCFDGSGKNLKSRLGLSDLEAIIKEELQNNDGRVLSELNRDIKGRDYTICPVCISSICISHDGYIYPCEGWQSYTLGNIKEQTLRQVWENSTLVQELRDLTFDDFQNCRECEDRGFCSICLIRNANESKTGSFREINSYYCKVAKLKRETAQKERKSINL